MFSGDEKYIVRDCYGFKARCIERISVSTVGQLRSLLQRSPGKRVNVVGNFSNTILASEFLDYVMVRLEGEFSNLQLIEDWKIKVGAGVAIPQLLNFCLRYELGGLEFMVGIPGTVGGVIYCNAGAFGEDIGNYISEITCMDREGNIKKFSKGEVDFSYRYSGLRDYVILEAILKLRPCPRIEIKGKMQEFFVTRMRCQGYHDYSCGCFFKNPSMIPAGRIIEEVNLKGKRRAGSWISEKHGNFILGDGDVHPHDVLAIKDVIQRKVWKEKRLWLEPEVEILW
jgi:UDP-N-acetylmuramate dehydrogenase